MALLDAPPQQPLARWLRLLWDAAPPLHLDSEAPFIADGSIHLPAQPQWQQHRAAAAHAAAHLVYSPRRFDTVGLVPTARALLGLLEDARVEALAMRELPGLARLWRPLHTATPDSGRGCEALMARLARALADPAYADPDPWVAKGRRLFYLDEALGLPALRTPDEVRAAAMRLGHDLGQMRLPFNARGYRPAPAYRDDHRWMWPADQLQAVQPPPAPRPVAADAPPPPDPQQLPLAGRVQHHPEWDRLIRRLRPDWARVVELPAEAAPLVATDALSRGGRGMAQVQALGRQLIEPLRRWARPSVPSGRALEGDAFHLDALLGWAMARRCGRAGDARVHRARQRCRVRSAAWVLVDSSASTAAPVRAQHGAGSGPAASPGLADDSHHSVLRAASRGAAATAHALNRLGVACTVAAFQSDGRRAVRMQVLQPGRCTVSSRTDGDALLMRRLLALRPAGSTRVGAALRHAVQQLGRKGATVRWVLLVSDGQPHDIDVHDPDYLVDDARHAVQAARRRGVRMACLTMGAQPEPQAARIFGARACCSVADVRDLPRVLKRLSS